MKLPIAKKYSDNTKMKAPPVVKVLSIIAEYIIDYFVRECVKREQRFRICKNCGKYFALTGYINTEYCNRPFDSIRRTCKEIGGAS